jgi:integrase/recombinase XerD
MLYYKNYKLYFKSLLSSDDVPEEDKKRMRELLTKRWNPYVLRHSAITEKSGIISSDQKLRQFAGWTPRSNMHYKYVHFSGGESMGDLLRAKGIIKKGNHINNILQPKICPSCKESNRPDASFCFKCNFVMSFEAYQKNTQEKEKKDQEINKLRELVVKMGDRMENLDSSMQFFRSQFETYREIFGNRPLTAKEREKIKQFQEQLETLPDVNNEVDD